MSLGEEHLIAKMGYLENKTLLSQGPLSQRLRNVASFSGQCATVKDFAFYGSKGDSRLGQPPYSNSYRKKYEEL